MTYVEGFKVESDERGFELHICVDEEPPVDENGWMVLNCHAMASEILQEVQRTIGEWWAEGQAVARMPASAVFRCAPEDIDESGGLSVIRRPDLDDYSGSAYDISDPKHPEFHSVHADIWDSREGK